MTEDVPMLTDKSLLRRSRQRADEEESRGVIPVEKTLDECPARRPRSMHTRLILPELNLSSVDTFMAMQTLKKENSDLRRELRSVTGEIFQEVDRLRSELVH